MEVLRFKTKKILDLLGYFKQLSELDKLRLTYHFLDSHYLHLDIDKEAEKNAILEILMKQDKEYMNTIMNFNHYGCLTILAAKFLEMNEFEKDTVVLEMLDNISLYIAIDKLN